jgi:integrase
MAFIRKLPSGKFRVRYRDLQGKERGRTFSKKGDAKAFKNKIEGELERGEWLDPALARTTFSEWCDQYVKLREGARRKNTNDRDTVVIETHLKPILGGMALRQITPDDIQGIVDVMKRKLKPKTVETNYGVLRAIMNSAVNYRRIAHSPCQGILRPYVERKRKRALTKEEIRRIAEAVPEQYRALIWVGSILGPRWSELAGLKIKDVNVIKRTMTIERTIDRSGEIADTKTAASRRTFTVPRYIIEKLNAHIAKLDRRDPDAWLFPAPHGGPLSYSNFRVRVWTPAVKKAAIGNYPMHGLRYTAGALMIEAGAHIEIVKQRLGHSSIRVTSDIYGAIMPTVDSGVADALDEMLDSAAAPEGHEEAEQEGRIGEIGP